MVQGIIYYTDNRLRGPIYDWSQKTIAQADLPIVSCSLKPIEFGQNIVVEGKRSYPTMVRQIITALENHSCKYVFFCEHDVLYHKSHFDFVPPEDDVFFYNENVWRWWIKDTKAIRHTRLWSLSCMVANREFALDHYRFRMRKIEEWGLDEFRSREPRKARIWGYEPGTKTTKRGGFSDDKCDTYYADYANIDIRHHRTFSSPKCHLSSFKHPPRGWEEVSIYDVPGWGREVIDNIRGIR